MAIGYEGHEFVNWYDVFAGIDDKDETVIDGLAFKGRWTAIAGAAKAGKSTLLIGLAVPLARMGVNVVYYDREMGLKDVHGRIEDWMQFRAADLDCFHYCEVPSKFDTEDGAYRVLADVEHFDAQLVIVDGLNGVVQGGENDDTTWRDFYELTIAPCKTRNIAVVTTDNSGKDRTLGPRGSSVKLDKADAVLEMKRTDLGCRLTATHRRTAAYPPEQHYAIVGADDDDPPLTVTLVEASDPEGTGDLVAELNKLGLPLDVSQRKARAALKTANISAGNAALCTALRLRRTADVSVDTPNGETPAQSLFEPRCITVYAGNGEGDTTPDTPVSGGPGRGADTQGVPTLVAPWGSADRDQAREDLDEAEIRRRLKEQF